MGKKEKSIEENMQELQYILDTMSSDELGIDESIKQYALAAELIGRCQTQLRKAQVQVQEIDEKMAELGTDDDI